MLHRVPHPLSIVTTLFAVACLFLAPGVLSAHKAEPLPDEDGPALLKTKPLAANDKDDELHKLLKERFNAALKELQAKYQQVAAGRASAESLADAGRRLMQAGLEVYDDPKDKITLMEKYVEVAKEAERIVDLQHQAGKVGVDEMERARYFRADAEIALLRLKGKPGDKPK
jgi:hypothetical protein